jgi:hypothetical protein
MVLLEAGISAGGAAGAGGAAAALSNPITAAIAAIALGAGYAFSPTVRRGAKNLVKGMGERTLETGKGLTQGLLNTSKTLNPLSQLSQSQSRQPSNPYPQILPLNFSPIDAPQNPLFQPMPPYGQSQTPNNGQLLNDLYRSMQNNRERSPRQNQNQDSSNGGYPSNYPPVLPLNFEPIQYPDPYIPQQLPKFDQNQVLYRLPDRF